LLNKRLLKLKSHNFDYIIIEVKLDRYLI